MGTCWSEIRPEVSKPWEESEVEAVRVCGGAGDRIQRLSATSLCCVHRLLPVYRPREILGAGGAIAWPSLSPRQCFGSLLGVPIEEDGRFWGPYRQPRSSLGIEPGVTRAVSALCAANCQGCSDCRAVAHAVRLYSLDCRHFHRAEFIHQRGTGTHRQPLQQVSRKKNAPTSQSTSFLSPRPWQHALRICVYCDPSWFDHPKTSLKHTHTHTSNTSFIFTDRVELAAARAEEVAKRSEFASKTTSLLALAGATPPILFLLPCRVAQRPHRAPATCEYEGRN